MLDDGEHVVWRDVTACTARTAAFQSPSKSERTSSTSSHPPGVADVGTLEEEVSW